MKEKSTQLFVVQYQALKIASVWPNGHLKKPSEESMIVWYIDLYLLVRGDCYIANILQMITCDWCFSQVFRGRASSWLKVWVGYLRRVRNFKKDRHLLIVSLEIFKENEEELNGCIAMKQILGGNDHFLFSLAICQNKCVRNEKHQHTFPTLFHTAEMLNHGRFDMLLLMGMRMTIARGPN